MGFGKVGGGSLIANSAVNLAELTAEIATKLPNIR